MKDYKNFFEAIENVISEHLGFVAKKSVDTNANINENGIIEQEVYITYSVLPFVSVDRIKIEIILDQNNNLLTKF